MTKMRHLSFKDFSFHLLIGLRQLFLLFSRSHTSLVFPPVWSLHVSCLEGSFWMVLSGSYFPERVDLTDGGTQQASVTDWTRMAKEEPLDDPWFVTQTANSSTVPLAIEVLDLFSCLSALKPRVEWKKRLLHLPLITLYFYYYYFLDNFRLRQKLQLVRELSYPFTASPASSNWANNQCSVSFSALNDRLPSISSFFFLVVVVFVFFFQDPIQNSRCLELSGDLSLLSVTVLKSVLVFMMLLGIPTSCFHRLSSWGLCAVFAWRGQGAALLGNT